MRKTMMNKVICVVVAALFLVNDLCYGLGVQPGSTQAGTKAEMYALGQKLFAAKIGPGAIDWNAPIPAKFIGEGFLEYAKIIKTDYANFPVGWKNNSILKNTDLIKALKDFMHSQANIGDFELEIEEGYFPVDKTKGELPIARIEKLVNKKYALIVHTEFVQMWNHIRANDIWFEYKFPDGQVRTISMAWALFYRLAKHEMSDIEFDSGYPKSVGHLTRVWAISDMQVMRNETMANMIRGRYSIINDGIWMWFLTSYCFNNNTRYNNKELASRIVWLIEGSDSDIREMARSEFPNLAKSPWVSDRSRGLAYSTALFVNYHFFSRAGIEIPKTTVDPKYVAEYETRETARKAADIKEEPLYATGKGKDEGEKLSKGEKLAQKTRDLRNKIHGMSAADLVNDLMKGEGAAGYLTLIISDLQSDTVKLRDFINLLLNKLISEKPADSELTLRLLAKTVIDRQVEEKKQEKPAAGESQGFATLIKDLLKKQKPAAEIKNTTQPAKSTAEEESPIEKIISKKDKSPLKTLFEKNPAVKAELDSIIKLLSLTGGLRPSTDGLNRDIQNGAGTYSIGTYNYRHIKPSVLYMMGENHSDCFPVLVRDDSGNLIPILLQKSFEENKLIFEYYMMPGLTVDDINVLIATEKSSRVAFVADAWRDYLALLRLRKYCEEPAPKPAPAQEPKNEIKKAVPVQYENGEIFTWTDGMRDGFIVTFNRGTSTIEMRCPGMSNTFLFTQSPQMANIKAGYIRYESINESHSYAGIALKGMGYDPVSRTFFLVLSEDALKMFGNLGRMDRGEIQAFFQYIGNFVILSAEEFSNLDQTDIISVAPADEAIHFFASKRTFEGGESLKEVREKALKGDLDPLIPYIIDSPTGSAILEELANAIASTGKMTDLVYLQEMIEELPRVRNKDAADPKLILENVKRIFDAATRACEAVQADTNYVQVLIATARALFMNPDEYNLEFLKSPIDSLKEDGYLDRIVKAGKFQFYKLAGQQRVIEYVAGGISLNTAINALNIVTKGEIDRKTLASILVAFRAGYLHNLNSTQLQTLLGSIIEANLYENILQANAKLHTAEPAGTGNVPSGVESAEVIRNKARSSEWSPERLADYVMGEGRGSFVLDEMKNALTGYDDKKFEDILKILHRYIVQERRAPEDKELATNLLLEIAAIDGKRSLGAGNVPDGGESTNQPRNTDETFGKAPGKSPEDTVERGVLKIDDSNGSYPYSVTHEGRNKTENLREGGLGFMASQPPTEPVNQKITIDNLTTIVIDAIKNDPDVSVSDRKKYIELWKIFVTENTTKNGIVHISNIEETLIARSKRKIGLNEILDTTTSALSIIAGIKLLSANFLYQPSLFLGTAAFLLLNVITNYSISRYEQENFARLVGCFKKAKKGLIALAEPTLRHVEPSARLSTQGIDMTHFSGAVWHAIDADYSLSGKKKNEYKAYTGMLFSMCPKSYFYGIPFVTMADAEKTLADLIKYGCRFAPRWSKAGYMLVFFTGMTSIIGGAVGIPYPLPVMTTIGTAALIVPKIFNIKSRQYFAELAPYFEKSKKGITTQKLQQEMIDEGISPYYSQGPITWKEKTAVMRKALKAAFGSKAPIFISPREYHTMTLMQLKTEKKKIEIYEDRLGIINNKFARGEKILREISYGRLEYDIDDTIIILEENLEIIETIITNRTKQGIVPDGGESIKAVRDHAREWSTERLADYVMKASTGSSIFEIFAQELVDTKDIKKLEKLCAALENLFNAGQIPVDKELNLKLIKKVLSEAKSAEPAGTGDTMAKKPPVMSAGADESEKVSPAQTQAVLNIILAVFSGDKPLSELESLPSDDITLQIAKAEFLRLLSNEQTEEGLSNETEKIKQILDIVDKKISGQTQPQAPADTAQAQAGKVGSWELGVGSEGAAKAGEKAPLKTHARNEEAVKDVELIKVISEYIVRLGLDKGPGSEVLTGAELEHIYKSIALLHESKIELFVPQGFMMTETMKHALEDMGKRQGREAVIYRPYSNEKHLAALLKDKPDSGTKRMIIVLGEEDARSRLSEEVQRNPEVFRMSRFMTVNLPENYRSMKTDEKTIHQAKFVTIALLARLFEKDKTPMVEAFLKYVLRECTGISEDALASFVNEIGLSDDEAAGMPVDKLVHRIVQMLGTPIKLVEKIGREIQLMKAFWTAA